MYRVCYRVYRVYRVGAVLVPCQRRVSTVSTVSVPCHYRVYRVVAVQYRDEPCQYRVSTVQNIVIYVSMGTIRRAVRAARYLLTYIQPPHSSQASPRCSCRKRLRRCWSRQLVRVMAQVAAGEGKGKAGLQVAVR